MIGSATFHEVSADRVDKGWVKQGLGKYSTEAILGSLQHYGAAVQGEAEFKAMGGEKFPLEIAEALPTA